MLESSLVACGGGKHPRVWQDDTYSHAIPAMQETVSELVASLVFDA
jgi:hypothetical protein